MAEANTSALATLPSSTGELSIASMVQGFKGALKPNCMLESFWIFAAKRHGFTMPKGQRNSKATKLVLEKKGVKPEQIKGLRMEFDGLRKLYWRQCSPIAALLVNDHTMRKTVKLWENKKGDLCSTIQCRKVKGEDAISTIEALQAKIAELEGKNAKALPA
jgi:hypothetical protein